MITIVNGYVCTSSCEAASARAGKDPNAPPGVLDKSKNSPFAGQPATILGDALSNLTDAVGAASGSDPAANAGPLLNRLI